MKQIIKLILFIVLIGNVQKNFTMGVELPAVLGTALIAKGAGGTFIALSSAGYFVVASGGTTTAVPLAIAIAGSGAAGIPAAVLSAGALNLISNYAAVHGTAAATSLFGAGAVTMAAAGVSAGAGVGAGAPVATTVGTGTLASLLTNPVGWAVLGIGGVITTALVVAAVAATTYVVSGVAGASMAEKADGKCFGRPHFLLVNDMPFPVEYRLYSESFPTRLEYKYTKVANLDVQDRLNTVATEKEFYDEVTKQDLKLAKKSNVILIRVEKKNGEEIDTFKKVQIDEKGFKYISVTLDPKVDKDAKFIWHGLFFERGKKPMITGVEARFKDKEGTEHVLFEPGTWDIDRGAIGKGFRAYRAKLKRKFNEKTNDLCTWLAIKKRGCTIKPF